MLAQQMQAKRDAAAAAAAAAEFEPKHDDDDDDDDVFDGGQDACGEAGKGIPAAVRSSPSGDSFATIANENQLDKLLVADSRLELSGLQDRLSVASIHSPVDYVALPTVRLFTVSFIHCDIFRYHSWLTDDQRGRSLR